MQRLMRDRGIIMVGIVGLGGGQFGWLATASYRRSMRSDTAVLPWARPNSCNVFVVEMARDERRTE